MSKTYKIEGMKCAGCARKIGEHFSEVDGVEGFEVNLDTKEMTVHGDYNEQELKESLVGTKYAIAE